MDLRGVSNTHRYGRVSNLLSGRQTTHAAQRTAKSTLTYELGTGKVLPRTSTDLFAPIYRHRDEGRVNGPCITSACGFLRPFLRLLTQDHMSSDCLSIELFTFDLSHFFHVTLSHAISFFRICYQYTNNFLKLINISINK